MSFVLKTVKILEWCTELPSKDYPKKTPIFLLKGVECFFRFALEKQSSTWYYNLYVELKSELTESENFQFQVGFKKEQELSLGEETFTVSEVGAKEIWYTSLESIRSKLPSDYMIDNCVKFQFTFECMLERALEKKKLKDDKCLQTASYLNTDVTVESLTEDFQKLLDAGVNHDAEIKCGEHSIKAHKNILCRRSEVFNAMLQSDMLEGRTGIVVIQDVDVSYVQDFLRYLYTGIIPELTFHKAKTLYEFGDKYAVRSLMLRCSEYLRDNMSQENAFQCFALADAHSDEKLKARFTEYILKEKIYLQEELWFPFCESYPKAANEVYKLSHKNLNEKEDM